MKYFVANWKMYAGPKQSLELAKTYKDVFVPTGVKPIVAPTALALGSVAETLRGSAWEVASQNAAWAVEGAYTGAISAQMYAEAGAKYALLGHSERRYIFGETDTDIQKKVAATVAAGIVPIVCIGETADDLVENKRQYRLKKQLQILQNLDSSVDIIIAYEPVWAIGGSGQGRRCLPADVVDIHGFIRTELATYGFVDAPIIYGGSVTGDNAQEYAHLPEVHGLIVATASVHLPEVKNIITALA